MFDNIINFFKKFSKDTKKDSKDTAKERLHLVLMQDRANVSADFLEMMKQEIIEVIKKYIDVDENSIDVKLTNKVNSDGTTGAPALYANIPIVSLKDETKKVNIERKKEDVEAKLVRDTEGQDQISPNENIEKKDNEETTSNEKENIEEKIEEVKVEEIIQKDNNEVNEKNIESELKQENEKSEEIVKETVEEKTEEIVKEENEETKQEDVKDSEKIEVE